MTLLAFKSYLLLMFVDLTMQFRPFSSLQSRVRSVELPVSARDVSRRWEIICSAMDLACVFYPKKVLCLQRSTATTMLLRSYGHRAEIVIGVKHAPFQSHAWVEIGDVVVNDKPYMRDIYQILDRY